MLVAKDTWRVGLWLSAYVTCSDLKTVTSSNTDVVYMSHVHALKNIHIM